ncbi:precorrin-8X methylmutase [Butyrivibrio sp. VCB2006]|uniref:precorrin-8X methylmutase n=1 Tax=Butyrivibrio sp. VCB2006 TaxID=1280679 RepID=UPI0004058EB8|nr:precorrin-8X methylmutase [Butyrivibrio sp. VCB2006]
MANTDKTVSGTPKKDLSPYGKESENVRPEDIEKRSFEIITKELEEAGIVLDEATSFVTKRCIHTSADFDYAHTLFFSEGAVDEMKRLIRGGACIVTDTNMGLSGINKKKLASFGGEAMCFMADEDVTKEARERGVTRAAVSMEKAAKLDKDVIFAIGNAPTALIKLHEMMQEGIFVPKFVIGVPVGFVNVVWAKELFLDGDVPYIINKGRKGGSNIAAAICNAVLYNM